MGYVHRHGMLYLKEYSATSLVEEYHFVCCPYCICGAVVGDEGYS